MAATYEAREYSSASDRFVWAVQSDDAILCMCANQQSAELIAEMLNGVAPDLAAFEKRYWNLARQLADQTRASAAPRPETVIEKMTSSITYELRDALQDSLDEIDADMRALVEKHITVIAEEMRKRLEEGTS